ncbi:MAG TPA: type 1 glutamine amidotransferase [Casimicrobiaceae bacterium]|nr:type 1 glutamine amidotransferase [Casimicrobiaceae bacterium]
MRPVAIFRFSPTEGPGYFGEWLARHDVPQRLIAVDQGESVPRDPRAFCGIAMMGGPMSANDDLPWNTPLMALLDGAMRSEIPVLGHCLGGQLLAKALGANVTRSATPEVGWGEVRVLGADDWFGGRDAFTAFHWHYEIFGLPRGATRVLTNAWNPDQAFLLGKHVGFQCHIEMTWPMVETWCRSGAAELPERTAGQVQSRADMFVDVDARLAALSRVADDFYARWAEGLAW